MRTIDDIVPKPATRGFLVASVGAGKSTVGGTILERYHRLHSAHRLFIIDPKRRFFAQRDRRDSGVLLPDGATATNHGRRDGVSVHARLISGAMGFNHKDETAFLIQDIAKARELFVWLYEHHDVRKPVLLYCDESFDFADGARADKNLRRLIQQGRELGIGALIVNQRPVRVDRVLLTEAEYIIAGNLHHPDDRKTIADIAATQQAALRIPIPRHEWWLLDQVNPERSFKFHINLKKG